MFKRCHFYRSFISRGIHGVDVSFLKVYPSQGINLKSRLIVFVVLSIYILHRCTNVQLPSQL